MLNRTLIDLAEEFVVQHGEVRILLVSPDGHLADALYSIDEVELAWVNDAVQADDIDIACQADMTFVASQLEKMSGPEDINLLCRLRDCNCDRIVLSLDAERPSAQELLAIGFYRDHSIDVAQRIFHYDRELFFEPRQWNTPEHWAHPANFDKRRW